LVSFDVAKCFDSLPWDVMFDVAEAEGMDKHMLGVARYMYRTSTRRFWYAAGEGEEFTARNGIAQGCPLSPEFLKGLMEVFRRYVVAKFPGYAGCAITVYADDMILVATSVREAQQMVDAFALWADTLGVKVNASKCAVLVPCSLRTKGMSILMNGSCIPVVSKVKVLGAILECPCCWRGQHWAPRQREMSRRLALLASWDIPGEVIALMTKTSAVPAGVYGCEIQPISQRAMDRLQTSVNVTLRRGYRLAPWSSAITLAKSDGWPAGRDGYDHGDGQEDSVATLFDEHRYG